MFCGPNNCGKSLLLKLIKRNKGKSAYLMQVNRFYHVFYIQPQQRNENELDQFEQQFLNQFAKEDQNHEQNFINLQQLIVSLDDNTRDTLWALCGKLLNTNIDMKKTDPNNDLSMRYIDMDGQNVSIGSTGTRLLLTILGMCFDKRFKILLIDEPELGLSPRVQNTLSNFFQDQEERKKYFPHLEEIYLATHSHIFLSRKDIQDNFAIVRNKNCVSIDQIIDIYSFNNLQFNLLGNDLNLMFLPSAIIIVEGPTDQIYIERIVRTRFPGRRITVFNTQGDGGIPRRVRDMSETLGSLSSSPFCERLFVVLDSTHTRSEIEKLKRQGVMEDNIIIWSANGIEYFYPEDIIRAIFSCDPKEWKKEFEMHDDTLRFRGIEKRKRQLCEDVVSRIDKETKLPDELVEKLLTKIDKVV